MICVGSTGAVCGATLSAQTWLEVQHPPSPWPDALWGGAPNPSGTSSSGILPQASPPALQPSLPPWAQPVVYGYVQNYDA